MNEKHNIDRLFREKFKDFEVTPPELVWENIEDALRKKKKRRVIPLWIKLSGVAAVLVIGSLLTMPYLNTTDINKNPVVIDKNGNKRIYPTDNPLPNNGTIIVDSTKTNGPGNSAVASDGNTPGGVTVPGNHTTGDRQRNAASFDNNVNAVAHSKAAATSGMTGEGNRKNKRAGNTAPAYRQDAVAYDAASQKNTPGRNTPNDRNKATAQGLPDKPGNNQNAVAAGSEKAPAQQDGQPSVVLPATEGTGTGIIKPEEAVADSPVDTSSVIKPENELEKLLQEKLNGKQNEDKAVAEAGDKGKWNIKPQVAPVFYNSLSQGSPIDSQFANSSKSFDNDLSYGVGINYAVTDRLSIRSGINTLNLSYATNDIQFSASLNEQTSNVSANARTANIVVTPMNQNPNSHPENMTLASFSSQTFNGSMVQKTGYIEVPVEMSYALLNKNFGIDVIGGVSTLFLNQNNVSVVSTQGYSTDVGEAENLNNIHFSTNVGIGFRYRFWKQFQANFEPMFKYQVNAYSRDAGNFKPYFIGLYSGISFSF